MDSTRFDERARIIAGRGIGAVVPIFFNFRGVSTPESKALCEPVPVSIIKQSVQPLAVGRPGRLGIDVQVDGDDVMVKLNADTAMLSERVVRLFLETLPTLLEFVALHPEAAVADADAVVPEGFAAHTRCQQVGSSWVNSARIAAVLMSAPGVRDAAVDIEGDEVVASLELASDATLFDVHEHVLANLDRHLDAVAPHVYRRPATGGWWPSDAPVAGWRPLEMDIRLPISTRAERELCNAIEQTHGHRVDNMALTYAAAGGRLLLAPAVVEILRRCGLVGLRSCHFTSAYTLRSVACALHPAATSVVFESYLW